MATSTAPMSTENQEVAQEPDFDALAAKVDQAFASVQGLDADAKTKGVALKNAIEEFHKVGLTRIVHGLKADPRGLELLMELAAEPSVYALFSMHGLIRANLRTRVSRVIEMIRPHIQSQGGDVELNSVEGNVAFLKMPGSKGCSTTANALRTSIEEAIRAQVPEIQTIEVVPNEPAAEVLVQIISSPPGGAQAGWVMGPATSELHDAKPFRWDIGETSVLLLRFDGRLQAFRNACAHQGLPLDGGVVDVEAGTIACPWHGFRFDCQTGECLTAPAAQLETFPVQIKDGHAWVKPA
jgi:nitrite reductase/ring-hydroxylating ferredoxin subunit/Fe-S cluster biogenesis protein NfuA